MENSGRVTVRERKKQKTKRKHVKSDRMLCGLHAGSKGEDSCHIRIKHPAERGNMIRCET